MIIVIKNNNPTIGVSTASKVQLVLKVAKSGKTEILAPKVTPNNVHLYLKVARDGQQGPMGPPGQDGIGIPAGGNTGQVLVKNSGTNYDTKWADATGGGGSVTYTTNIGDGTSTTYNVTHSLGSTDVMVEVVENSTKEIVYTNVVLLNTTTAQVSFSQPVSVNQYKVIVKK